MDCLSENFLLSALEWNGMNQDRERNEKKTLGAGRAPGGHGARDRSGGPECFGFRNGVGAGYSALLRGMLA